VKQIMVGSKVIKCDLVCKENLSECVWQTGGDKEEAKATIEATSSVISVSYLKPGFLVRSKVTKLYENGVEITFLGGLTATCFVDHLPNDIDTYKIGQRLNARLITTDPLSKKTTASMLPKLVDWQPQLALPEELSVGSSVETGKVLKVVYGGSYLVQLPNAAHVGFLHKTHSIAKEPEEVKEGEKVEKEELAEGQVLTSMKIKEFNYFDQLAILTLKEDIVGAQAVDYSMLKIGDAVRANVVKVNHDQGIVTLALNEFIKGTLHLEQMGGDTKFKLIPSKF